MLTYSSNFQRFHTSIIFHEFQEYPGLIPLPNHVLDLRHVTNQQIRK